MFYSKEKRPEYQAKHEGIKFGPLSTKIAASWKLLSDEEKKKFVEMHEEDKARYDKEIATYVKPDTSSESESESEDSSDDKKKTKGKAKKPRAKKDPDAPKGATNPYMCFQKERREQIKLDNPSLKTLGTLAKKMGEIWRGMSEDEKKPFVELAAKDKKRFLKEKAEYEKKKEKSWCSGFAILSGTRRLALYSLAR